MEFLIIWGAIILLILLLMGLVYYLRRTKFKNVGPGGNWILVLGDPQADKMAISILAMIAVISILFWQFPAFYSEVQEHSSQYSLLFTAVLVGVIVIVEIISRKNQVKKKKSK